MRTDQFQRQLDDEKVEDGKIKRDGDIRVVMYKPNYGSLGAHVLVFLLIGWWTLGTGNLLYAAYKWYKSLQKVVRDTQALENPQEEMAVREGIEVTDTH